MAKILFLRWAALALITLVTPRGWADVQSFEIVPSTNRIMVGASPSVIVRALNADGSVDTNYSGELPLELKQRAAAGIVISEIETTNRVVEFVNTSTQAIDMSGWDLSIADNSQVNAHLVFPAGFVAQPSEVFLFSKDPIANPPVRVLYPATPARQWVYGVYTLRDSSGGIVDQVSAGFVDASSLPVWHGSTLVTRPGPWARVGTENHFNSSDWSAVTNASRGVVNPGLELPWVGSDIRQQVIPATFTNGIWSGSVLFDIPPGSAVLAIRDDLNHGGLSERIVVESLPTLTMTLDASVQNATESAPGTISNGRVELPEAAQSDVTIMLTSSDTNEFRVPAAMIIPSGERSVSFTLTNIDDITADGAALVKIVAAAPGYARAETTVINGDNETGQLYVVMPSNADEDTGFQPTPGRVFLGAIAQKDIYVSLRADPILRVPESVIIPKGRSSATFEFAVDNDDLYSVAYKPRVWARTDNWPEAVGTIRVEDNDDPNMSFTVPEIVWQGEPGEGIIRLNSARHTDAEFVTRSGSVNVPARIIIPAGAKEARFPITYVAPGQDRITISLESFTLDQWIVALPSTPNIAGLIPEFTPWSVFSGESVPMTATLGDSGGIRQYTNVTGEIRLVGPAGVSFTPRPIHFTNGFWAGEVAVTGFGTDAQFEISAAGFTNRSMKFNVVKGGVRSMAALDMAWHSRSNVLIVSEGPATNAVGRLVAVDPLNPDQVVKAVDLPAPATAISLSEDESIAWLVLANARFQKVDLLQWTLAESAPVSTNAVLRARDILVLPGANDKFVAVVGPASNQPELSHVQLFVNGIANTNTASISNFGPIANIDLVRGRDASEFLLQQPGGAARYMVGAGITRGANAPLGGAPLNTVYADGFIYNGTAGVVDPTTLAIDNRFGFVTYLGKLVFPFPELSRLYTLYQSEVAVHDLLSGERLGATSINGLFDGSGLSKAIRTSNGFAFITNEGVVSFAFPLIEQTRPDVAVNFIGPTVHTNKVQFMNERFQWEVEAVNHGPGRAPGVVVRFGQLGGAELGELGPGERRVVRGPLLDAGGGVLQETVRIFSALPDQDPTNNEVVAQTQVKSWLQFTGYELPMKATALISTPDRNRLYAGFSVLPGIPGAGIAVVDPETGTIERTLASSAAPKILAVSADNQFLYGLTSTNEVTRWNLQTFVVDRTIRFTNETVLRMATPPNGTGRVVIATDKKVAAYDGDTELPSRVSRSATFRWLGISGANLWMSEPARVYRLAVSDTGVGVSLGPISADLPTANYQFYADTRRLYFDSYNFDLTSRTVTPGGVRNGFLSYPESGRTLELFGNRARVIDAATLTLIAEDLIPFQAAGDSARFGDRGVAVIGPSGQLALYKVALPLLPLAQADLQLTVTRPPTPYSWYPLEWVFTVQNNSSEPALNARLILDRPQELREPAWDPTNAMTIFYTSSFELGTLAPGASAVVMLGGYTFGGNMTLSAKVISNSPDPNTNNNTYAETTYFRGPVSDLVMTSLSGPATVARGNEAVYGFTIRNAGTIDLPAAFVELHLGEGVELPDGILTGVSLNAGESKTVNVRMKMTRPGLIRVAATLTGNVTDEQMGNNSQSLLVAVEDPAAPLSSLVFPAARLLAWSEARQEIIASFPEAQWSLVGLDPVTLKRRWSVNVNFLPRLIAPTDDGRYVWVALAGGGMSRVDLQTGLSDINFNLSTMQAQTWAIGTPPGRPEVVVVAFDPSFTGQNRVQVFENGVPKPVTLPGAGDIVFLRDGRGFISGSQLLREFRLISDGLAEVNNFDTAGPWGDTSITTVDDALYFSNGRMFNTTTRAVDDRFIESHTFAADQTVRQAYRMVFNNLSFGRAYFIENFDIGASRTDWKIPLEEQGAIIPLGTNGVLVSGSNLNIYKVDAATKATDLAVTLSAPTAVAGPGVPFTLTVGATNQSIWRAASAEIVLKLPPGTSVLQSGSWTETNELRIALGSFQGSTNLTFEVRQQLSGDKVYEATISNAVVDSNLQNNSSPALVSVAPAPIVLIDDFAQAENAPLVAYLSSPAASEIHVAYTAAPLNADGSDIESVTGYFTFLPGWTAATASIIAADFTPELDESIVLNFSSESAPLIRTQAVVNILNDDLPRLTPGVPGSITEGNAGTKPVTVTLTLSPAPFASEVEYETVSGTAVAGRDFIAQSGRVRFAAGETTKSITLEIIGNTTFEPTKTFSVTLKNPANLTFPSSSSTVNLSIRNDDAPPTFPLRISTPNATSLAIGFEATPSVTYQLETRTNLVVGNWSLVVGAPQITGTNGVFTIQKPSATRPINFYRIRAM